MHFVCLILVERDRHVVVKTSIADQVNLEVRVHLRGNCLACLCVLLKTGVCYRESIANEHLAEVKRVARNKVSQRKPDDTLAARWTGAANHIWEICITYIKFNCQVMGSTRANRTAVQAAKTEHLAFPFQQQVLHIEVLLFIYAPVKLEWCWHLQPDLAFADAFAGCRRSEVPAIDWNHPTHCAVPLSVLPFTITAQSMAHCLVADDDIEEPNVVN
jgi:hypothetical protein